MSEYTVLLFGPAADAIGKDRVIVRVSGPCRCDDLKAQIACDFPDLESHLQVGRLAVNQSFVRPDASIDPTDEIALITMVSGG